MLWFDDKLDETRSYPGLEREIPFLSSRMILSILTRLYISIVYSSSQLNSFWLQI